MVRRLVLKFHTGLGEVNYQCLYFLIHKEVRINKLIFVPGTW